MKFIGIPNAAEILKPEEFSTFSKIFDNTSRNSDKFSAEWVSIQGNLRWKIDPLVLYKEKNAKKFDEFLPRFSVSSGAKVWQSCRSRKMLKNDYLLAKIGVDTAENEPRKEWCVVASGTRTELRAAQQGAQLRGLPRRQAVDEFNAKMRTNNVRTKIHLISYYIFATNF